MAPAQIVSGGQTGVDRAALSVAVALGLPYGGWCPRGGWAEDLPQPPGVLALFPELEETPSAEPEQRTRWNIRDSDATLVIGAGEAPSAGTALTLAVAVELGRELAMIDIAAPQAGLEAAKAMLDALPDGASLNVAGPRESEAPGIGEQAAALLIALLEDRG